jgi:PPOX class probable F420-dependent enzyme
VILTPAERDLLAEARRATLATIAADGRSRLVPICYVFTEDEIWSPIDEKRKAVDDPRRLARVRDISRDPRVTLLIDRWSEEWADLAWLRIEGRAELVASVDGVVQALRARYPQYAHHDLERRPMLRIAIERATSWFASAADLAGQTDPSGHGRA